MAYVSKEEKKIEFNDPAGKWTDMTLLPEWQEKFYDVYTAKKHGKWVMLKALKPEYRDDPKYQAMLENEFETRSRLAHPNIVMVTDYEVLPSLGACIITDDAYGYSLRRLIDEKRLTPRILRRLQTQLLDAMDYIQEEHVVHPAITPDNIIFTEYNENLKLINVGYAQKDELTPQDTDADIRAWGEIMGEVLPHLPESHARLKRVAERARQQNGPRYHSVTDLRIALERRSSAMLYIWTAVMILLLCIIVFLLAK